MALRVMQIGAIAVVIAVSTFFAFELDRFFVPKELALHLTAVIAGLATLRRLEPASRFTRLDWVLFVYLILSVVSTLFVTNIWLAVRAVAITASGMVLFWTARTLRESGVSRPLLGTLAFAVTLVAITSLLQTYGVELLIFSEQRAPGGTLGNRNFVAHAGAFGLPVVLLATLRARGVATFLAGAIGATLITATLVLTRSRAAWLAFGAVAAVFVVAMLLSPAMRRDFRTWRRLLFIAILAAGGVAAAILIPNTLRWRSDNPYLESVQRVADYQQGSGRGRLIQYEHSLRMTAANPILGVGPGNWPVRYPRHAARRDPSINDSEPGMTFNPWPSSDWIAWISERGFFAVGLLALVFAGIGIHALRQLVQALDLDEALVATALLATIVATIVAGAFDAVLLIALPTFLVWAALGALWVPKPVDPAIAPPPSRWPVAFMLIAILISAAGAFRSASQLVAMGIYATTSDGSALQTAAIVDPANYRLRMRLARMGGRGRCAHALAASALYPNAEEARALSRGCD